MAFTRFHDDPARIEKQLQESTGLGRYMLNVPGNGDRPSFSEDPFLRMQKWGANLMTNAINVESDLLGLTRSACKDNLVNNDYSKAKVQTSPVKYPSQQPITDQSRATHPAWTTRDLEQVNWAILPLNPQENTCYPFENNLSTRILEKDTYVPCAPLPNLKS
jgi:hypothetical protein